MGVCVNVYARAPPRRALSRGPLFRNAGPGSVEQRLRVAPRPGRAKPLFVGLFRLRLGRFGRHLVLLGEFFRRSTRAAMLRFLEAVAALAFCDVVIPAREITHGSIEIAIGGAIGAGEVFDAVAEVGRGVAQALGGTGVADPAGG